MAAAPTAHNEAEVLEPHDLGATVGRRLAVTVVTPRGQLLAREADEVVVPGALGELGILPGHLPVLAAVRPGVLVVRDGASRSILAVAGGYLQVGARQAVRVLVEDAVAARDVDAAAARTQVSELGARIKEASSARTDDPAAARAEVAVLQARLAWAQAQVDASERAK